MFSSLPGIKCRRVLGRCVVTVISSHGCGNLKNGSLRKVNVLFIGIRSPATQYFDEPSWQASGCRCCGCPYSEAVGIIRFGVETAQLK